MTTLLHLPGDTRITFKQGSHYGRDNKHPLGGRYRKGKVSFNLYPFGDWNPSSTGKLPGVLDSRFAPAGYGNNKPNPHGFSIRTWFDPGPDPRLFGCYVYHQGQAQAWGDHLIVGEIPLWKTELVTHEWDLDAGWVRTSVGGDSGELSVLVSAETAVDTGWVNGYHGGPQVAPSTFACKVLDYTVEATPSTPGYYVLSREQVAAELLDLADRVLQLNT